MAQTIGRCGLGHFSVIYDGKMIQFGIGYKA